MYGIPPEDLYRIDDLLDFSNDEIFSSSTSDSQLLPSSATASHHGASDFNHSSSTDFLHHLCVPNDDVVELEWLSNFVHGSFNDFPSDPVIGTTDFRSESSFQSRSRNKRSKPVSTSRGRTTSESGTLEKCKATTSISKKRANASGVAADCSSTSSEPVGRRCSHCASDKTPQWRTGPLGPKTLCNACGVRYKSGRLVPEYRPAASPTFVLTQHSNSHRKVLELRRQKEILRQQQQLQDHHQMQLYGHHRSHSDDR